MRGEDETKAIRRSARTRRHADMRHKAAVAYKQQEAAYSNGYGKRRDNGDEERHALQLANHAVVGGMLTGHQMAMMDMADTVVAIYSSIRLRLSPMAVESYGHHHRHVYQQ